jgi:hypothetical protein
MVVGRCFGTGEMKEKTGPKSRKGISRKDQNRPFWRTCVAEIRKSPGVWSPGVGR